MDLKVNTFVKPKRKTIPEMEELPALEKVESTVVSGEKRFKALPTSNSAQPKTDSGGGGSANTLKENINESKIEWTPKKEWVLHWWVIQGNYLCPEMKLHEVSMYDTFFQWLLKIRKGQDPTHSTIYVDGRPIDHLEESVLNYFEARVIRIVNVGLKTHLSTQSLIPIQVNTLQNTLLEMKVDLYDSMETIHRQILRTLNVPKLPGQQLLCDGKQMTQWLTASQSKLIPHSRLHMVIRRIPYVEYESRYVQWSDLSDSTETSKILKMSGPSYHMLRSGLGLSGKCFNLQCEAYGERVVCNVGYTTFDFSHHVHLAVCPCCHKKFHIDQCLLTDCSCKSSLSDCE